MYSRPHKHSDSPIHLPENYSGCAFAAAEDDNSRNPPPPHPIAESAPTGKEKSVTPPQDLIKKDVSSLFAAPLSLLGGVHFEELLLIGLILLLAKTEQGSDVILWLALLLFCK